MSFPWSNECRHSRPMSPKVIQKPRKFHVGACRNVQENLIGKAHEGSVPVIELENSHRSPSAASRSPQLGHCHRHRRHPGSDRLGVALGRIVGLDEEAVGPENDHRLDAGTVLDRFCELA